MNCDRCSDDGFYFDPHCMDNTCAHGGRTRSPAEMKRLRKREAKDAAEDKRRAKTLPSRLPRVKAILISYSDEPWRTCLARPGSARVRLPSRSGRSSGRRSGVKRNS